VFGCKSLASHSFLIESQLVQVGVLWCFCFFGKRVDEGQGGVLRVFAGVV